MTELLRHDDILEERARRLAQPPVEDRRRLEELLVCRVAGRLVGLPLRRARTVLPPGPLAWVPDAPPAIAGIRDVAGRLVAVADPCALLGVEERPEPATAHVVVLEGRTEPLGLLIDALVTIGLWEPVPSASPPDGAGLLAGIVRHGPDDVVVLDCDAVLADARVGGAGTEARGSLDKGAG